MLHGHLHYVTAYTTGLPEGSSIVCTSTPGTIVVHVLYALLDTVSLANPMLLCYQQV